MKTQGYIDLLSTIGIPGLIETQNSNRDPRLMELAQLNKIALLYSTVLGDDIYYKELLPRYEQLVNTLMQVSIIFNKNGIKYSIFKTIKPFPTTPSDIDVLLPSEDFSRAEALLISSGYIRTAHDAYSSTLQKEMIVDLQLQPSVSNLPYASKQLLMKNTVLRNVYGCEIRTLNPEAEVIVIASHSFYKEQMFTLNDYYAITILAEQLDIEKLAGLAEANKTMDVLRIITGICSQITESVFNTRLKINDISQTLASQHERIMNHDALPIKFPFGLVLKLLLKRATKDKEMRRMMMPALMRLASPTQFLNLIKHLQRTTY